MKKSVNIAFAGSGLLYPTFIGTLLCLEDNGISIAEVSGTSGGSIIAAAYASGLNPRHQMIDVVKSSLPFWNWLVDPSLRIFKNLGLIKGNKIQAVFEEKFCKVLGNAKIPLYITTTNISAHKAQVFSSKDNPEFSTALAVRTSIAVPLVFAPTNINGELFLDGGLSVNLPLSVFNNDLITLGFKFGRKGILGKIKGFFSLLSNIFQTMIAVNEKDSEDDATNASTIFIKTNYSALNFFVSKDDVDLMIADGYQSTQEWIMENYVRLFGETSSEIQAADESVFSIEIEI